jgi:hypothetical protein
MAQEQDPFDLSPEIEIQDFNSLPDQMPPTIIEGLVRKSEILLVGGHSKSWKSWAMLDLLFCIANGFPWLCFQTTKGLILHIDLELLSADVKRRFRLIQESYGKGSFENLRLVSLRGQPFNLADLLGLVPRLENQDWSLIFLDPTYRLHAGHNESDPGVITELLNKCLAIGTFLKTALALLQHFSKGNQADKTAIERFSGTSVWGRYPDALLTFTQHEDEEAFTVEPTLRAFPPIDPFAVRWEYPRFRLAGDLDPEKLRHPKAGRPKLNSAEQLAGLIHADESISYSDLCRRAQTLCQMKKRTFDRRLAEAKRQSLIYLSPLNDEYALTSEYLQRNGDTI